jgi:hypothetical protein
MCGLLGQRVKYRSGSESNTAAAAGRGAAMIHFSASLYREAAMTRTRIAVIVIAVVGILGASLAVAQMPPPLYKLLPHGWPQPLLRTCLTQYGVCAIPHTILPGTPCHCQAANGTWIPGFCSK